MAARPEKGKPGHDETKSRQDRGHECTGKHKLAMNGKNPSGTADIGDEGLGLIGKFPLCGAGRNIARNPATNLSAPRGVNLFPDCSMKLFHCAHCRNLVYFESHVCVRCEHPLAYLSDLRKVSSLERDAEGILTAVTRGANGKAYKLCANYEQHHVCNWAIPADDPEALCHACRLTRVIPDTSAPGARTAWYKLETAKRRVIHALGSMGLPVKTKVEDPEHGLAFSFLADSADGSSRVMTGHEDGLITIALAEADDPERERRRTSLHEPFRTLLGHFRHEVGHYFWDRLVRDGGRVEEFRAVFGDESFDYHEALRTHYANGPKPNWEQNYITAYASVHPWEDWAETWAHYMHMVDALETAEATRVAVEPLEGEAVADLRDTFGSMVNNWHALTHMLNNLNRSLGLLDAYPFIWCAPATEKMRYIHDLVTATADNATVAQKVGVGT